MLNANIVAPFGVETPRTNDTSSSAGRSLTPPSLTPYENSYGHPLPRATVTPLRHAAPRWLPIAPRPFPPVVWPAARPLTPPPVAAWTPRAEPPVQDPNLWQPLIHTRAVTPPPLLQPPPPTTPQQQPQDQGWITVSTANMSPFMILRIKALIELAAIQGYHEGEKISASVTPSVTTKSCLRKKVSRGAYEEDMKRAAENYDAKCVAELNSLLEESRRKPAVDPRLKVQEANNSFDQLKRQLAQHNDCTDTRLAFSPGATLICFDSGEKPRKIRENHARHFNYFLMMQRQALGLQQSPPPSVLAPPPRSVTPLNTPGGTDEVSPPPF